MMKGLATVLVLTLVVTLSAIALRVLDQRNETGGYIDPYGMEVAWGSVTDPHGLELAWGHVIDPSGVELAWGFVIDPHGWRPEVSKEVKRMA